jgi:hypothetical protein
VGLALIAEYLPKLRALCFLPATAHELSRIARGRGSPSDIVRDIRQACFHDYQARVAAEDSNWRTPDGRFSRDFSLSMTAWELEGLVSLAMDPGDRTQPLPATSPRTSWIAAFRTNDRVRGSPSRGAMPRMRHLTRRPAAVAINVCSLG